jgi:hypothetical protein
MSLITGLFCILAALPAGATGVGVAVSALCVAAAAVIGGGASTVCDSVVQACDDDPARNIFHLPPPKMNCKIYWDACDARGVITAHLYDSTMTAFGLHLYFWFSVDEFGFNTYSAEDLNLREITHTFAKTDWLYEGFLYAGGIPGVHCTRSFTVFVYAVWGDDGSAAVETGGPKLYKADDLDCGT